MTLRDLPPRSSKAHELLGDFWFNSDPVPVSAQRGNVILLFFWDYSCVHCLRALPYVRAWERAYGDYGLVTVGVHAPRFAFGKDPENVRRALGRHEVRFPVVTDNDLLITARYDNRALPAIYLIDAQGFVRTTTSGEGEYASVEHMLHALLYETGVRDLLPLPLAPLREEDRQGVVLYRATPEIFTGYLRGSLGNVEGYSPESVVSYADPGVYMDGRVYAVGLWLNDRNCLRLSQDRGGEGQLVISYHGLEAGAVISPDGRRSSTMEVRQDGRYLTAVDRGADVQITPDGRSIVSVDGPRFYELVRNREFGDHVLRLTSRNPGNAVYSFAFITGIIPETVNQH